MPLYKLQHGKQSYNSNEQNSIEYAGSLRPSVIRNEQEQTWKLLTPSEITEGWEIGTNMMALLRSDSSARSAYYRTMREIGAYSVDDILAYEDLPAVPGGKARAASLNFVPLDRWEELSVRRAGENGGTK
jgi:phage portal protein BeeE